MQLPERIGVVGWWDRSRCHWFVVGPQGDGEAIPLIDEWLDSRLESGHRASGFDQVLSELDFELGDLMLYRCHPDQNVAGQEAQSQPVRVMKDDRVADRQAE